MTRANPSLSSLPLLILCLSGALATAGCAARTERGPGLPAIPGRTGPLDVDVVYPPEGSTITARDSNFIFGSVGDGRARLRINGIPVEVQANGSFLAWLPVPEGLADTLARYELVAWRGTDSVRHLHSIRLPGSHATVATRRPAIDTTSLAPRGVWWVRPGELVPVRVRATRGAAVRLRTPDGEIVALERRRRAKPTVDVGAEAIYAGEWIARQPLGRGARTREPPPVPVDAEPVAAGCRAPPGAVTAPNRCAVVEAIHNADTARTVLPLDLWILESPAPVVELRESPSVAGSDGVVVGRPSPGGPFTWLWADGMRARVSGRRGDAVRLLLDSASEAWVALDDLVWRWAAAFDGPARVGTVRLEGAADRLRVRIDVERPVAYAVAIEDRRLTLTLYDASSDTDWLRYGPRDDFLRAARWEQPFQDRYLLHLELASRPWGWRARYGEGELLLEVRKPPPIDPAHPLQGRTIVVDPGHPPAGALGPTRLYEGDANLAIALRLRRQLERRGARVILTRADRSSVRLYDRVRRAEWLGAELLVSIHNNALPDGVNPFGNHGTSVFYYHEQELDLARALQSGLLAALGLRDLGVSRGDLALARPTWMPSALTEGAFMMIPAQEAALRQPEFLEAYARGVVDGLRAFLQGRAE